jgi:hypothetical protein
VVVVVVVEETLRFFSGAVLFMPPFALQGRLPTWILLRQQQGTGRNGGGGGAGEAAVFCYKLPLSWQRGLSVSTILLVAVIRAGISYRELLVRYAAMASYNNDDDTDTVYHVNSTTRWIQQTSGMSVTNRPAAVQGGVAIQDSLGKDNHGENAAAASTLMMTAMSLPLVVADDHPPSTVTIVERSIRHVEPPPPLPLSSSSNNNNITAAVCFKTLFGEIDLGLVIQWAGT